MRFWKTFRVYWKVVLACYKYLETCHESWITKLTFNYSTANVIAFEGYLNFRGKVQQLKVYQQLQSSLSWKIRDDRKSTVLEFAVVFCYINFQVNCDTSFVKLEKSISIHFLWWKGECLECCFFSPRREDVIRRRQSPLCMRLVALMNRCSVLWRRL